MAIFGIDLGTTNSCMAFINKFGQPEVCQNSDGKFVTPSVVYFQSENDIIVGDQAKAMAPVDPQKVVECIKRDLRVDEKYKPNNGLPYGKNPIEISSMILKKMKQDYEDESPTGDKIEDVVITVPANFSEKDKQRTLQAGQIAGLNVLRLLTEPQAAAYYYGMANVFTDKQNVLVFDLGGGTFDLCLLRITGKKFQALTTDGEPNLGGKDWDVAFAEYVINKINKEQGLHLVFNPHNKTDKLYRYAMSAAEIAKIGLTSSKQGTALFNLQVPGEKPVTSNVTRQEFDNATRHLLDKALEKTDSIFHLIQQEGWQAPSIIILVGGSSRMPQVRNALEQRYNIQVRLSDPDTCVSKGAAFYAAQLGEGIDDDKPIIPSIATKSYGLGCEVDGKYCCSNIILKDSKLPVTGHDSFSTLADGQETAHLVVFENNIRGNYATAPNPANSRANASFDSIILKEVDFDLSGAKPKGYPLQVEFYLDENGLLQVSANTQDGNCKFDVLVEGVMTETELQNSKEEMDDIKIY